jgi:tetratricopeptide (TPR) repeat protein
VTSVERRDFSAVLKRAPDFYPSTTGLGFVALAGRQFKSAVSRFDAALESDRGYLPAWVGKADAELGLGNDGEAIDALEKILTIDPKRDGISARLELVRFRRVQTLIETGRKARRAGRLDEAEKVLEGALTLAPTSALILSELAAVEIKRGELDEAEQHLKRIVQLEPNDTDGIVALATFLGRRNTAKRRAPGRKRSPWSLTAWRKVAALRTKANLGHSCGFRDTAARPTITRAVAATLASLADPSTNRGERQRRDRHPEPLGKPWIAPLTRAVMEVREPHVPARASSSAGSGPGRGVRCAGRDRSAAELARWRAARPRFADLPATNLFYRAAALSVAAGALSRMVRTVPAGAVGDRRRATTAVTRISENAAVGAPHGCPDRSKSAHTASAPRPRVRISCCGWPGWALVTFMIAGATDVRWPPRRLGSRQPLAPGSIDGGLLLVASMFVMLTIPGLGLANRLPLWLTVLVLSRDLAIVLTVAVVNLAVRRRTFRPSMLCKVASGVFVWTGVVTLFANYQGEKSVLVTAGVYLSLALTLLSSAEYVIRVARMLATDEAPSDR